MPQKALSSPASASAAQSQNVVSNDGTNFKIPLPSFLAGVISVGTQSATHRNSEIVVEIENYPGEFTPLLLENPETGERSIFIRGPGQAGWARTAAFLSVRIRRVDFIGGDTVNVFANFREGTY